MQRRTRDTRTGRFQPAGRSSSSSSGFLSSALGIAGGIGVGAAVMYLLDPNQGEERRHQLAEKAGGLAHGAWDTISDHASDAGSMIASAAPAVGERLMDRVHHAGESAQEAGDAARGWLGSARSHLPDLPTFRDLRGRVSAMIPFQRQRRMVKPVAIATAAAGIGLTALAVGATAMYLFDPDRGRSRRAWLGQKATRAVRETGQFMRATGRHLANKGQGYYHDTRSAAREAMDSAAEKFGGGASAAPEQEESQVPSI